VTNAKHTPANWPELIRSGMAVLFLILAFMCRGEGAQITGAILFGISSGLGLFAWLDNLRIYRLLHDTPTSSIASAAQGYVKLAGHATALPGQILKSPLSNTECVWHRCFIPKGNWHGIETGESDAPFLLVDAMGQCVIEPTGAEIYTHRHSEWREPDKGLWRSKSERQEPETATNNLIFVDPGQMGSEEDYFEEWLLLPGDPLLAMGCFISDQAGHAQSGAHRLCRPLDGRPFLLGAFYPLVWRYLFFALLNLATFFVGLWGTASGLKLLHWLPS
jgi:hypothetical protein